MNRIIFLPVLISLLVIIFISLLNVSINYFNRIEVTGITAYWDGKLSLGTLKYIHKSLNSLAAFFYHIGPNGDLEKMDFDRKNQLLTFAKQKKIHMIPVVGDDFDRKRVELLLYNQEVQKRFISKLVEEDKKEGFEGWYLDIETLKSSDEHSFSQFVKKTAEGLHKYNIKLYMILYARTGKDTYDSALAQNYKEIGKYADLVGIMVYNFHNNFTSPGGQTPLDIYDSVLAYAKETIDKDKIVIGLTTNGYDWSKDKAQELTFPEVEERIHNFKAKVFYDQKASSGVALYKINGEPHSLWFEDAKTINEKIRIAHRKFGINKFFIWRLGAEDPAIWHLLE